jgi:hypothetical protein
MWEVGLPPLLWSFPPTAAFTSFPAPDCWVLLLLLLAGMFVYSSHGKWVFPLSCGVFLPPPVLQAFPLLVAGCTPLFLPSLARPGSFIYSSGRDSPFPSSVLRAPHPLCYVFYCSYCLLLSFSFFPRWGLVCPGGYADLAQSCLWKYLIPLSSPCPHLPKPSRHGRLVAARGPSWFLHSTCGGDTLHRLEVWKGQGLFLVALPARCVSSVSPRFHFRRHAFSFLPLAAILESPLDVSYPHFLSTHSNHPFQRRKNGASSNVTFEQVEH